jgi:acetolactate synthase-1/2/3 large subunit
LKERVEAVIASDGPVVCELMMDHDQVQAPKAVNRRNPDGTITQTSLEDSFPFLTPQEVEENMSIIHKL